MGVLSGSHTVKQFDQDLASLRNHVLAMGGLVEDQIKCAVDALAKDDSALAQRVIARDREIDRMQLKADEEAAQLLALRTPLGSDLRMVLTLIRTTTDLERVGDEAKKIARMSRDMIIAGEGGITDRLLRDVDVMSRHAISLLHGALDALVRMDVERAGQVKEADDQLDDEFDTALVHLTEEMVRDRAVIAPAVNVIFIIKALERIGDHSKNIAEYVFYLVEGRDIRHPKAVAEQQGTEG
ncbi:MAG TPA: phosphate signaling complex protein PhoU [Xanthomonadaceae bacterium]|nr:phosphate signaling complex protein PhoU [Xanthomonadaceae bacterium]